MSQNAVIAANAVALPERPSQVSILIGDCRTRLEAEPRLFASIETDDPVEGLHHG